MGTHLSPTKAELFICPMKNRPVSVCLKTFIENITKIAGRTTIIISSARYIHDPIFFNFFFLRGGGGGGGVQIVSIGQSWREHWK